MFVAPGEVALEILRLAGTDSRPEAVVGSLSPGAVETDARGETPPKATT
jgi:hypothetical protein